MREIEIARECRAQDELLRMALAAFEEAIAALDWSEP